MSPKISPIILVDGSSYLYRAFHALPALTNSKGFPTGAVYGMISMLKKLLADYQPEYMVVIFDAKGKTFRDEIYADYKATRHDMPNDLAIQIETIHHLIRAMGLPIIMMEGVEADDIIGTLSIREQNEGYKVVISTGDKDLAQLVNDDITLINTMTNSLLDPDGVKAKFGVPPERIVDYLTLVGDTSDNIPGVPQVGPKTAAKWLNTYGSLANLITHAAKITGKVGDNFRAFIDQIPLTQSLVTIKSDIDVPLAMRDMKIKPADKPTLISIFKEMEFKAWLSELLAEAEAHDTKETSYTLITSEEMLDQWLGKLIHSPFFIFETETTSLNSMQGQLVGIALALSTGEAAYIPFGHVYPEVPKQLDAGFVLKKLKPLLENPDIKKIGQHIKYDMAVLFNQDIHLKGILFDTMLESYVLDSASTRHDLDSLALKYLGTRTTTHKDLVGTGSKQISFNEVNIHKAKDYAAEDVETILKLHHTLWPRIESEPGIKQVFEKIELPLISVLSRMECNGVLLDDVQLTKYSAELEKRLKTLEKEIYELAGTTFNINSPKQLQEVLFDTLHLPILQKTPTGQPSTADPVLQELALDFAIPRLIIEYRSLSKLISTYTYRLIEQINPRTGRVHTSYNQAATATGRLSSSEPNLQNIPIRTAEGRLIRQSFIAKNGFKLLSADYSQIELRLMAHISEDPNLLHAFNHNLDIHTATAAEVWNVPLEEVTHDMRRNAKAINFGLIYGMSAFGLTRQLGIDRKSAEEYIERYFTRYPNVKNYMDQTRAQAREKGFVETLFGRRLYLPDIRASQIPRQKAAERAAINGPLQGSAADIIKLAMIKIDDWLAHEKINAHMIMQVHDELVFEVEEADLALLKERISELMTTVLPLKVPLQISIGVGDNWDEASKH